MKKSTFLKKATTSLSLVLLGGGIAVGGNYLLNSPQSVAQNSKSDSLVSEPKNNQTAIAIPQNYVSNVVNQVGDSVVRIDATRTVVTNVPDMFNDPFFVDSSVLRCPIFPTNEFKEAWDRVL